MCRLGKCVRGERASAYVVCVCKGGGGKNNIKEGNPHGSRAPPWSPRAPPKSLQLAVCAPSCPAPVGVTAGGLAWVRTSSGVGLCDLRPSATMLGRVLLHHPRPLCGRGGVKQRILSYHMTPVTQVIGHRQQHCSAALQHCLFTDIALFAGHLTLPSPWPRLAVPTPLGPVL